MSNEHSVSPQAAEALLPPVDVVEEIGRAHV